MGILEQTTHYDFYHLPGYHALAEQSGEGTAILFGYTEDEYVIALPLLLRAVEQVPGLEQSGKQWVDATSVYGYAGPLTSHLEVPQSVVRTFQHHLANAFRECNIVASFSRLHPLVPQQRGVLDAVGECVPIGQTVSIDLTLTVEQQRSQYKKGHRSDVNKLKRQGFTCVIDAAGDYLDEFIAIYHETMQRVNASDAYFFDRAYFEGLLEALGPQQVYVVACLLEQQVVCAGLFTLIHGIVQYHLSGSREGFGRIAPSKLMLDTVRLWATEQGAHVLHLGGGVGSREDSLFQFKAGFSDRRHPFEIWRWVVQPEIYQHLNTMRETWLVEHGLQFASSGFFPLYRCATSPAEQASTNGA
jgi:hypothetical protein